MAAFDTQARAIANGAGVAQAIVPGPPPGKQWELQRISVSIPTMATTAIVPCRVYRNLVAPGATIGATRTGQLDTDSAPQCTLSPGEQLVVEWQSVTVGAACTVTVGYLLIGM